MSIYKQVLGDEFNKLHPMLQKRYALMSTQSVTGKGVMFEIKGAPWFLRPVMTFLTKRKLLFPEQDSQVPFIIKNFPYSNGKQIHWERAFNFPHQTRYFNALMSLDEERLVIKDYLGEPPLLYSDLVFSVEDGALLIRSLKQRLIIGSIEVPLPKWFQGVATVKEDYLDEKEKFEISVHVNNPILGQLFHYKGEFTSEDLT